MFLYFPALHILWSYIYTYKLVYSACVVSSHRSSLSDESAIAIIFVYYHYEQNIQINLYVFKFSFNFQNFTWEYLVTGKYLLSVIISKHYIK